MEKIRSLRQPENVTSNGVIVMLFRHGESLQNLGEQEGPRRIAENAALRNSGLTDLGEKQSIAIAEYLKERNIKPVVIVTSKSKRSVFTGEIVRANIDPNIRLDSYNEFHEKGDGVPRESINGKDPGEIRDELKKHLKGVPLEKLGTYVPTELAGYLNLDKYETVLAAAHRMHESTVKIAEQYIGPGNPVIVFIGHASAMASQLSAYYHLNTFQQDPQYPQIYDFKGVDGGTFDNSQPVVFNGLSFEPKNTSFFTLGIQSNKEGKLSFGINEVNFQGVSDVS